MIARSVLVLALAAGGMAAAGAPALVTVSGAVGNTNRAPVDPLRDKLFVDNGNDFDRAHAFTLEALRALPQTTVRADFPLGGEVFEFSGPSFEALLEAAGASGETVTVQALDGYTAEIGSDELRANGAILALDMGGEPLDIGGLGPAMVAYPRAEREDLAGMNDDTWVWQVFHVGVE
ncbi:hypothetical protein GI374_15750 [Paracoccus sp. S-4012]|uniref:molybdopterin-dependent oxidoreductase n=1 Tax=Paracoccus sp. S-4012 TaxID=2665648 RepID=UPI0012B03AA2|nr:molybdopterin-dependent oxidoreductase [Paracoccus sp. S-4012]MRX51847.1 hypothetical protein [Paracoccus sp. S-4012]